MSRRIELIKCPKCGKQNQDHYKFCLGCGNELPRDVARVAAVTSTHTPPTGLPAVGQPIAPIAPGPKVEPTVAPAPGAGIARQQLAKPQMPPLEKVSKPPESPKPAPKPAVAVEPSPAPKKLQKCPSCGAEIPPDFAFCGRCGTRLSVVPVPAAMATAAPQEPVRAELAVRGKVVMIQPNGAEGISLPLLEKGTEIGRNAGSDFKDDYFLSPQHARFTIERERLFVEDLGSLNGIYIRLLPDIPYDIQSGDFIRIGQEVVKLEVLPEPASGDTPVLGSPRKDAWGRIALILGKDKIGNAFTLQGKEVLVGRERGNIMFPEDGYVSGLHIKISRDGERITVTDLKSSNGTYLKIRGKREVKGGDYLLIGQFLYRVDF